MAVTIGLYHIASPSLVAKARHAHAEEHGRKTEEDAHLRHHGRQPLAAQHDVEQALHRPVRGQRLNGRADRIGDRAAWIRAGKIAKAMLDGAPRALTEGATYFHTPAVRPSWSRRFEKTAKIGRHIFYRAPIVTAMN